MPDSGGSPAESAGWRLRPAGPADIPHLVALRRLMFESMGFHSQTALDRMAEASSEYMGHALPAGEFRAWVAEAGRQVVGGGAMVIRSCPPSVRNLAGREGYLMNIVTLPAWRRQGIATAILQAMLDALRAEGVPAASLHYTPEGQPIYERAGFRPTNEMRLRLIDDYSEG